MTDAKDTTTLKFACACRKVQGSVEVPSAHLPLPVDFCHCSTCRHQTGLLCGSYLTLPKEASALHFEGPLTKFRSSRNVTRAFCSDCGTNIFFYDLNQPWPDVPSGILENADGVCKLRHHIFVPETKDGGLASWMDDMPAWEGYSSSKQIDIKSFQNAQSSHDDISALHAYCRCKGVQFDITRPTKVSTELSSPPSDLISAHNGGEEPSTSDDNRWWLCANGTKYLAGTCACRSCRLASGFDIQMWTFIPKANIFLNDGRPFDFNFGTLKRYQSSEGTYREFCSRCGATVFWHNETRPELIDVSVGLLDAAEGSRAESWLEWKTDRISFEEEAQNKALIHRLSVGLKQWGCMNSVDSERKPVNQIL